MRCVRQQVRQREILSPIIMDDPSKTLAAAELRPGPRWNGEGPVLLSPDGTRLAWVNEHALHLWDAVLLKPRRPAEAHEREVWAMAFSPDGNALVSAAGEYGFIRRWNAATG